MYQIVVVRKLQGRGIFVTENRNEPNTAMTPRPDGIKELPVILGRKLAAKERRTLLESRNKMKRDFGGEECHISPSAIGDKSIKGPCMHCPICFTYGGLVSGGSFNYGRAAIVLYDDAFNLGDSRFETLTFNSVDDRTQRTGQALGTESFVYGGTFVGVITVKHDDLSILNLVLDAVLSTGSYGARDKYYGRMMNAIPLIIKTSRPLLTSYDIVSKIKTTEEINTVIVSEVNKLATDSFEIIQMPKLGSHEDILREAHRLEDLKAWYAEVDSYKGRS